MLGKHVRLLEHGETTDHLHFFGSYSFQGWPQNLKIKISASSKVDAHHVEHHAIVAACFKTVAIYAY